MNTLSFYNFVQYLIDEQIYMDWYNQYNQLGSAEAKAAFSKSKPTQPNPSVSKVDLIDFDLQVASYLPVKDDTGKYSVTKTLAKVDNDELKAYLKYVALSHARGKLYRGSAKENARHSALTPIFLAAHKQYNNIKYEEWNKEDKFIRFAVGFRLYDSIMKWKDIPLSKELLAVCRRNALVTSRGKEIAASAWPFHNIKLDNSTVLRPTDMFRHIWLQTWVANVEIRDEYMILDVNNWDLMPEAFDAVFKPKVVETYKAVKEETPW